MAHSAALMHPPDVFEAPITVVASAPFCTWPKHTSLNSAATHVLPAASHYCPPYCRQSVCRFVQIPSCIHPLNVSRCIKFRIIVNGSLAGARRVRHSGAVAKCVGRELVRQKTELAKRTICSMAADCTFAVDIDGVWSSRIGVNAVNTGRVFTVATKIGRIVLRPCNGVLYSATLPRLPGYFTHRSARRA